MEQSVGFDLTTQKSERVIATANLAGKRNKVNMTSTTVNEVVTVDFIGAEYENRDQDRF